MRTSTEQNALPDVLVGKKVAILGAGKVGCAIGILLRDAGMPVVAVTTRTPANAENAAQLTGGQPGTDDAAAAALGDIVLLTMNDDAIAHACAEIAQAGALRPGQLVVHMSGALHLSVLDPAAKVGACVGCAHPLQSFASCEQAVRDIPGSVFGITAGPGALEALEALTSVLGGLSAYVDEDRKTVYHAAAVMASNYLVAVEDMAIRLLMNAGFDERRALQALAPLAHATLDNVLEIGPTQALTGPIVRGDVDTVRRHVEALRDLPEDRLDLYRVLGRHTLDIAARRDTLSADTLQALFDALADDPD